MGNKLSVEDLLKPRIQVISPAPLMTCKVGTILVDCFRDKVFVPFSANMETFDLLTDHRKYPQIFRELKWHEDRDINDMPQYLKTQAGNSVRKVSMYMPNYGFFRVQFDGGRERSLSKWFPATEEEYLSFINQQKS